MLNCHSFLLRMRLYARVVGTLIAAGAPIAFGSAASTAVPPNSDPHASWDSHLGSPDSSQYSSLRQINRSNVARLQRVWSYHSGDKSYTAGPIVIDGVMYVIAREGIAAIDAANGKEIWFAPGFVHRARGLAYWQSADKTDRRLIFPKDHCLMALDARTGKRIAAFGKDGCTDLRADLGREPQSIKMIASATPGRVFENLIIVGSATGELYDGPPGDVRAYDVRSGRLVWTFHTIPRPGEYGYDTWPAEAWKRSGGNNVWGEMSLDERHGIIFLAVGSPDYNFYGADRAGANLFGNCLVALDARTGKRLWHFQAIHHDLWDYNLVMAPKLLTVQREGRTIDAVAVVPKTGFIYVFDRLTGKPLFPIEERAVPGSDVPGEVASATQPLPVMPPPIARQRFTEHDINPYLAAEERESIAKRVRAARNEGLYTPPSLDREVVLMPGNFGGGQHGNGAVVPAAGKFFVVSVENPAIFKLVPGVPASYSTATERLFGENCAHCHGAQAAGYPPAIPALTSIGKRMNAEEFYGTVHNGRGRMPPLAAITQAQARELWEFLSAQQPPPAGAEVGASRMSNDVPIVPEGAPTRYFGNHIAFPSSKEGLPIISPPWSTLSAYDLNRGALLWRKPFGDLSTLAEKGIKNTGNPWTTASIIATASGLLFSATLDKKLRAWDQETGEVLWEATLPGASRALPATYEVKGRQFLVVAATSADLQQNPADKKAKPEPATLAYVAYALPE